MTGLEIFLIIIGVLIVIGIIIAIAVYFGVRTIQKNIGKILAGPFSFHPTSDSSRFVTSNGATNKKTPASGDTLVLSSSTSVKCEDYEWNFKDNFLELGTANLVAVAESTTTGTPIKLAAKGAAGDLNQWVFSDVEFTWCLKSNNKLCMFNSPNNLTLENLSLNAAFAWTPTDALKTPACS